MKKSKTQVAKDGYIYLINDHINGFYKIGFTKDVYGRFNYIRTANPGVELIYTFPGNTDYEDFLHRRFYNQWIDGEWFILLPEDVAWFIEEHKHLNEIIWPARFHGQKATKPDTARIQRTIEAIKNSSQL